MDRIFRAFDEAGKELFLVGGAVRELARGIDMELIDDLDFCTNALPQETVDILEGAELSIYDVGIEFGTVGTMLYNDDVPGYPKDCQITTYRSNEYYQRGSRHPMVNYGDSLIQDLKRRDFSINSIAMNAAGEYIDPYDGLGDLERGIIRVVGDPDETLAEDPLRILRVGRFIAKFGFDADDLLREACIMCAPRIMDISRERWLQEMTKLVKASHADRGLNFLDEVNILERILPEVHDLKVLQSTNPTHATDLWTHTMQVLMQAEATSPQRWGALFHDIGKVSTCQIDSEKGVVFPQHEQVGEAMIPAIAKRLKFDSQLTKEVRAIVLYHGHISRYNMAWSDEAVRRLVRELDPYVTTLLEFARANLTMSQAQHVDALDHITHLSERIHAMEHKKTLRPNLPSGIGDMIMSTFSIPPSRRIRDLKDTLEDGILKGTLENNASADYYITFLREHITQ